MNITDGTVLNADTERKLHLLQDKVVKESGKEESATKYSMKNTTVAKYSRTSVDSVDK